MKGGRIEGEYKSGNGREICKGENRRFRRGTEKGRIAGWINKWERKELKKEIYSVNRRFCAVFKTTVFFSVVSVFS